MTCNKFGFRLVRWDGNSEYKPNPPTPPPLTLSLTVVGLWACKHHVTWGDGKWEGEWIMLWSVWSGCNSCLRFKVVLEIQSCVVIISSLANSLASPITSLLGFGFTKRDCHWILAASWLKEPLVATFVLWTRYHLPVQVHRLKASRMYFYQPHYYQQWQLERKRKQWF